MCGSAPPDLQSADLFTSHILLPAISSTHHDVENFLLVVDSIADQLCSPDFCPFERSEHTGWPMALNEPLLLVHNLPEKGKKGWTKSSDLMQEGRRMTTILGTSGSGKTRLCFELLCQQYGIYFVAVPSDVLGSTDMSALTSFCETIFGSALEGAKETSNVVTRGVKCLVLSRLLVLRRLLSRGKVITPKNWLLFQTKPRVEGIYHDIFNRIFDTLLNQANDIYIHEEINTIIHHIVDTQKQEQFNIFLDEAQYLATRLQNCFPRVTKPAIVDRPLLSPVVYALGNLSSSRLFVCGSALSLLMCEELLQSPIAKWNEKPRRFVNLGAIDKFEEFTNMVRHLVPEVEDSQLKKPFGWLRGRYRFTATFIEHLVLQNRRKYDVEKALEDTKKRVLAEEESGSILYTLKSLNKDGRVLTIFKEAAVTVHLTGLPKCMTKREETDIIQYGLALLQQQDNALVAKLYEPLVLEAAKRFFMASAYEEVYRRCIGNLLFNQSNAGKTWEILIPWQLQQTAFNGSTHVEKLNLFNDVQGFRGFVALLPDTHQPGETFGQMHTKEFTLVKYLDRLQAWISDKKLIDGPLPKAFYPENDAGPDIILPVLVAQEMWLLLIQCKFASNVQNMSKAIATTDPRRLYSRNKQKKEKMWELLSKWGERIIRVIITYPCHTSTKSRGPVKTLKDEYEHAIIIIDGNSTLRIFDKDHIEFLDGMKFNV